MKLSSPWLIALLASVLLNGILIGFVMQRSFDGGEAPRPVAEDGAPGGPRMGSFDLRSFMAALPEDERREARREIRQHLREGRPLLEEARDARLAAQAALMAEDYDPQTAQAALQRMRESRAAIEAHTEAMIIELISDLDPETRRAVIEAGRRRGPPPGMDGHRPPPPHERPRPRYRDGDQ